MGLFGFAEILRQPGDRRETRDVVQGKIGRLLPTLAGSARIASGRSCAARVSARSSASCRATARCWRPFASYTRREEASPRIRAASAAARSRVSPGPRAANNAGAQTAFIPLLTLGIPPNAVMALMVGAMTIHGIVPGPQVMTKKPELFWGMIASMWIGNLMLLIINLPLVGLWVTLLQRALPAAVPGDPDVLLHRHLLDQQQSRPTCCSTAFFGLVGYRADQARALSRRRCCWAFVLGQADGGEAAAGADPVARQLRDVRRAA